METLADKEQFPESWLMKYRWGKGKKGNQLPTGEKITFLTVGGRTSAIVPSLQKKAGPVAAAEEDVEEDANDPKTYDSDNENGAEGDESEHDKQVKKRKRQDGSKTNAHRETEETNDQKPSSKRGRRKK